MTTWGINALNHDASIAVFHGTDLLFHHRSSEFSGILGDPNLNQQLVNAALEYGLPDNIFWYERPWVKKLRQLYAGQYRWAFDYKEIPSVYLKQFKINAPIIYTDHHRSHAAAGFFTAPFKQAAVVVIDAIGEWDSASIWYADHAYMKKVWSLKYPNSLGLFYSAFTDLVGLKATQQEHIFQQWSELGNYTRYYDDVKEFTNENLHQGVRSWPYEITSDQDRYDIAAAVQQVFTEQVIAIMEKAKTLTGMKNLVYMGGCAMNSATNAQILDKWDRIWSLPIPGDASSSIGAVLNSRRSHIKYSPNQVVKHIKIR